ncbi:MAG: hypothetical protein WA855_09070 [Candidatus Acidiferrales bacterium]
MKATAKQKCKRLKGAKPTTGARPRAGSSAAGSLAWIRELAAPYLKEYEPVAADEAGLRGYWFSANRSLPRGPSGEPCVGFFVRYLTGGASKHSFLRPEPPECMVFAWVGPAGGPLHGRIVRQPESLVRKIFEYIRWLTHRPPRFVFHEAEEAAMARHISMKDWPPEKREHLSRNFFIETLAWLVRSGLVRKLKEEAEQSGEAATF